MRRAVLSVMVAGCGHVDFQDTCEAVSIASPRIVTYGAPGVGTAVFDAWLATASSSVQHVEETTSLGAELLAGHDILIVQGTFHVHTADEAAAVARWVEHGGGLVSLTGYLDATGNAAQTSSVLAQLGVTYVDPLVDGPVTTFFAHPSTAGVTQLVFMGGNHVVAPAMTSIAAQHDGIVGAAGEFGCGRVVAWGDEWITYDSGFDADAEQFWTNVLAWLGHRS